MILKNISILFLLSGIYVHAQESPEKSITTQEIAMATSYKLKDLIIEGTKKYTPEQVLIFTGLQKGEMIEVPSARISSAIKHIWETDRFSDVELYVEQISGNEIVLRILLKDLKELGTIKFTGPKMTKSKSEKIIKDNKLDPGTKITESFTENLKAKIAAEYLKKGFNDTKVSISSTPNAINPDLVDWVVNVNRGKRIKIERIDFDGNETISDKKLRNKAFKTTKQKNLIMGILKPSKFIKDDYEADKKNLISYYNSLGFRDAKVKSDSVSRNEKGFNIKIKLNEGKKYYIGSINFIGNTSYTTDYLQRILGYKPGDIYDAVGFSKKVGEDGGEEDYSDIKSVYMNNGYLFSNVTPIEKAVKNDSIDLEIRINEGEKATWNRVTFSGNDTTHDHVILRALQTRPGDLFSKNDIKRTYFDLAGMQFFDPQKVGQDVKQNPQDNTVDIHWTLVEKGASQVQLQAGYGGNSFIGTLGLTFSNFSLRNFVKLKNFKPIPQGDGQTLAIQAQAGQFFQNYSLSFTEPWLFGTKPTALSVSLNNSIVSYSLATGNQNLNIFSANVGLNRRLQWPDNYFTLYTGLSYQRYDFNNYPFQFGAQQLSNGNSQTFSFLLSLNRNSAGMDPIFPTLGSNMELSVKLTPPYSLMNGKDYSTLDLASRYKWMEFFKVKFKAETYNEIIGKMVLRSSIETGFLSGYNSQLGAPPFERYYVGGTGLFGGRFDGRELVPLRGYENASSTGGGNQDVTPLGGATIYNRLALELRYPISMSQTAKIYALTFAEAGNAWQGFSSYNPFQLRRSAGIGIRVYMGTFGLLGFDFAYGFDKYIGGSAPSGWNTHFLMNQPL